MKLWEEGTTREERIQYREAEDRERAALWAEHELIPLRTEQGHVNPYWRDSYFMRWNAWLAERREELAMARGRPRKNNAAADKLLTALNFVKVATKDTGQGAYQTHVRIGNNRVVAFDGVLAAGHPIEEDFQATPNLEQLTAALEVCGKQLAMTVEGATITVKGDKMKATVECIDPGVMHIVEPDPGMYAIGEEVRTALEACMRYTREGGARIVESAVMLYANSCVGTNGHALVEYWHGVNLPDMILPRAFCAAVCKVKAKLVGFGWGDGRSVTFFFDDTSWIKTQLYTEGYPEQARYVLNKANVAPVALPADLLAAINAVAAFNDEGYVIFDNDNVTSHNDDARGATYEVKGLNAAHKPRFNAGYVAKVSDLIKSIDLNADPSMLLWFGDNVRGGIMAITNGGGQA